MRNLGTSKRQRRTSETACWRRIFDTGDCLPYANTTASDRAATDETGEGK
jgi:hypothetical protein